MAKSGQSVLLKLLEREGEKTDDSWKIGQFICLNSKFITHTQFSHFPSHYFTLFTSPFSIYVCRV